MPLLRVRFFPSVLLLLPLLFLLPALLLLAAGPRGAGAEVTRTGSVYSWPSSNGWTAWDGQWNFQCPGNQFLIGITSEHDNGREDRRWRFRCSAYDNIDTSGNTDSGYVNSYDGNLDFSSGSGFFAGVADSVHSNGNEDRRWRFRTRTSQTADTYRDSGSCVRDLWNTWDNFMNRDCPGNRAIYRMESSHDNGREDRQWYVTCCNLVANTPAVTGVSPVGGVVGTTVTVTGTRFGADLATVRPYVGGVEGTAGKAALTGGTSFQFQVPQQADGAKNVKVSRYGAESNANYQFEVVTPPVPTAVSPRGGPPGTVVTVTGSNYGATPAAMSATVGAAACPITTQNPSGNTLTCTSDASLAPGPHPVVVSRFNGASTAVLDFVVVAPPGLTDVVPRGGDVGATVVVSGSGFGTDAAADAIEVTLNGVVCTTVIVSDTAITVTLPPSLPYEDAFALTVARFGVPATSTLNWTYTKRPSVASVYPSGGVAGSRVTVYGARFGRAEHFDLNLVTVKVGDVACPVTKYEASRSDPLEVVGVECTVASSLSTGFHDVSVSVFDQTSAAGVQFLVLDAPTVTSASPAQGRAGDVITVTGTNFGSNIVDVSIVLGGQQVALRHPANGGTFSSTTAEFVVPAGLSAGVVDIELFRFFAAAAPLEFTVTA